MRPRHRSQVPRLFVLTLLAGAGCYSAPPAPPPPVPGAEVEGTVTLNGEPVPGGIVQFRKVDGPGETGGAITGGKYRIYAEQSLQPGTYRVEIRWAKPTGKKIPAGFMMMDETREGIPEKYNAKTALVVEVAAGKGTHDFALEGAAPEPPPEPKPEPDPKPAPEPTPAAGKPAVEQAPTPKEGK